MQVRVFPTYQSMSEAAAAVLADVVRRKPNAVLGLPTGATPEGLYEALPGQGVNLREVRTFNLDEYVGLSATHPQSYHAYMKERLLDRSDLRPAQMRVPDGMAPDLEAECRRYEAEIAAVGGLDLVVLGLGLNGHIGFNEPGTPWDSRTRPVWLSEATRQANAPYFGGLAQMPTQALTMGIGTILEARAILLLAAGPAKVGVVRQILRDEPTVELPATALRQHPASTILLDAAAAALIGRSVYS